MLSSAVWQEWGLYNGAIGEAVDIIYRPGDRPPRSLPACALVSFPKYCGQIFLPDLPSVAPISTIERILDCRRRCSRTTAPLVPARGLTFRKSQWVTFGAGRDAECAVAHPATPSFEKSHPGGLYTAMSGAISSGRGVFGQPGFEASVLYLQALCSRERIPLRVDNAITAGRDRAARRVRRLSDATKARYPDLESRPPDLVDWAKTPLSREQVDALIGPN